ncbi:MAG: chorismate-binding protein [Arthrobacter sp.]|uniref:chorismate-binding protein n=1 Tax=Arthrobacter sp. TaxID=1667 RepID=UPI0034894698
MARNAPVIIAVDGRSGAGKSTLALELATELRRHRPVSLFHLEDIYPGWDGLDGGIARYVRDVLEPLSWGEDARWTAWDWAAGTDGERRTTAAAPVVVVEGVGAACAAARGALDAVVWVEVGDDERRNRALARDGAAYAPHWERWAAQEDAWLATDPVPAAADVVVRNAADGRAPGDTLRALLALPRLQAALRPEIEQAAAPALLTRTVELPSTVSAPDLFAELYGGSAHAALLDSSNAGAADPGGRNRFSILADASGEAGARAEHRDGTTLLTTGCAVARVPGPFFDWLDRGWGRPRLRAPEALEAGFALGWIGWLGYELKRETGGTDISAASESPAGTPDAALIHAGRGVVLDHLRGTAWLLALDAPDARDWLDAARSAVLRLGRGGAGGPGIARAAGRSAADGVAAGGPAPGGPAPDDGVPAPVFACADRRTAYLDKVRAAQAEIHEGNSYEVCLTTALRASVPGPALDPWRVYLRLRLRNPAPFANYLRFGATAVAGTSPERFLRIGADGWMRAEPIKGTRRRSADPAEDGRLLADLASSPKDRAENVMIVDLLRNDLVRSADPDTLSVPRLCHVESYATVHQLVSTIDARLRPDASRAEAVASAFPAGSMTGAPKISTMRILDALEDGRARGLYSGAVGYFSHTGSADLSVVIRTLVMERSEAGWLLTLGVGGAVTADSVPEDEWDEVAAKAHGVLSALGSRFPDA